MTLSTALALTLLVGLPLVLLAAGVLWQAYLLATRQPEAPAVDPTDAALRAMATASVDDLLLEIQRAIDELQGQVSSQRRTLEGLMSAPAPAPLATAVAAPAAAAPTPAPAPAPTPPVAPVAPPPASAPMAAASSTAERVPTSLHLQLDQLLAEGLSDRAIARRLQVGLEEVRMARSLRGRP
ncbi:MAG: hypothetical protein R3C39_06175 [Dehalococcoidia bacterium]